MARGRTAEVRNMIVEGLREGPVEGSNATGALAEKLGIEPDTVFRDALKQLRDLGTVQADIDGRRTKRLALTNGHSNGEAHGDFDPTSAVSTKTRKAAATNGATTGRRGRTAKVKSPSTPYAQALQARLDEIKARQAELDTEIDTLNDEYSVIEDLLSRSQ